MKILGYGIIVGLFAVILTDVIEYNQIRNEKIDNLSLQISMEVEPTMISKINVLLQEKLDYE